MKNVSGKLWRMVIAIIMLSLVLIGCSSGNPEVQSQENSDITVYAKAPADWNNIRIWAWKEGGEDVFAAWPGETMNATADGWYTASLPAWIDRVIINGNDGTVQTADLRVDSGADVWILVMNSEYTEVYYEEPALEVPQNADDSVLIRARTPFGWDSVCLWAWKEGGDDAFESWPGIAMDAGSDGWYVASVPGWVDRVVISGNDGTVQSVDLAVEAGRDAWIWMLDTDYVDVYYDMPASDGEEKDPFLAAAERGDYETMKRLLPTITDRSILTDWAYNDFNYAYAADAIRSGDYATAIEFFGYCANEDNRLYAAILEQLLAGDLEGAIETRISMGFTTLDIDLDMSWPKIFLMVMEYPEDPSDLNYLLINAYLAKRMQSYQPSLTEDVLAFGEPSTWIAESYIGEILPSDDYFPIEDLNALYARCGSEANGKTLILRTQKSFPQGSTHYAIDLYLMSYLSQDMYPASLSEVEYVLLVNYGYVNAGNYQQTFTYGENDVVSYFSFLRMQGQVQLKQMPGGTSLYQSPLVQGTGEVEFNFGDLEFQCSNMPETGPYIISAVEKIREWNGAY